MSDDLVRLHVEVSVVSVSSSLVFFLFCTEDVYKRLLSYNNKNTDSRSTSTAKIYLDFS